MKVLKFIKYRGKYYQPGSEVEVEPVDIEKFKSQGFILGDALNPEEPEGVETPEIKEDIQDLKKSEIKDLLDKAGIEYDSKANKEELLSLLEGEGLE